MRYKVFVGGLIGLVVLLGAAMMNQHMFRASPCPAHVSDADLLYNALDPSFLPPKWDKAKLLTELRRNSVPYREHEGQVLVPACGANWVGKSWW